MIIMSQGIMVDNETKRPFSHYTFDSGFATMKEANAKQRFRRKLGVEFVNGWAVWRRSEWTEYQRYYEEAE